MMDKHQLIVRVVTAGTAGAMTLGATVSGRIGSAIIATEPSTETILTQAGAGTVLFLFAWALLKWFAKREDEQRQRADKRVDELEERCETLTKERTEALVRVAALEAELAWWRESHDRRSNTRADSKRTYGKDT